MVEGSSPSSGVWGPMAQHSLSVSTKNRLVPACLGKMSGESLVPPHWFHGVAVSTSPLHGLDTGSIPVGINPPTGGYEVAGTHCLCSNEQRRKKLALVP